MRDRRLSIVLRRLALLLAVVFVVAGCGGSGVTGPCDDSDPVGPCATSHGQTHGS
jgi:Na+/serine symporter